MKCVTKRLIDLFIECKNTPHTGYSISYKNDKNFIEFYLVELNYQNKNPRIEFSVRASDSDDGCLQRDFDNLQQAEELFMVICRVKNLCWNDLFIFGFTQDGGIAKC